MNPDALSQQQSPAPGRRLFTRWCFSGLLLAAVFYLIDGGKLTDQVQQLYLWPALLALAVSVLQVVLSAARWCYTAHRLALRLPLADAVREYYLASFLNQVLPGGVAGDANRAWRHGNGIKARSAALRAVMIERFSGQVVLALVAAASVVAVPALRQVVAGAAGYGWQLGLGIAAVVLVAIGIRWKLPNGFAAFGADVRRALFSWPAFAWQWLSSFLVLATYLVVFLLSARAMGIARPASELLPLVPIVLLAMVLPISVAGWGVREGAAALVWSSAGLPPEEGVIIAVGYGVLVLISPLPGILVIAGARRRGPQPVESRG